METASTFCSSSKKRQGLLRCILQVRLVMGCLFHQLAYNAQRRIFRHIESSTSPLLLVSYLPSMVWQKFERFLLLSTEFVRFLKPRLPERPIQGIAILIYRKAMKATKMARCRGPYVTAARVELSPSPLLVDQQSGSSTTVAGRGQARLTESKGGPGCGMELESGWRVGSWLLA